MPLTPTDIGVLESLKEYWLPVFTGFGAATVTWFTAWANWRSSSDKLVGDQVKLVLDSWEKRVADLSAEVDKLREEIKLLRKALDDRPECDDCGNRSRLEYEIAILKRDLDARQSKDNEHVQRMGD